MTLIKRVHLVGIKGVAMAALSVYLHESGCKVSGSDVPEDFPTSEELQNAGISVFSGFDASRVQGKKKPDVVYYTGAHGGRENVEVKAATIEGIPVFPHGQALGNIMANFRQIVVAGSHGKTTTSAMLAVLFGHAKFEPSYAIGCGSIAGLGAAGHKGKGNWFIAEGDEYVTDPGHDSTPRFLWLKPEILVVTNIDFDHPDVYPNLSAVQDAFRQLQKKSKVVILNADDPNSRCLRQEDSVITYGFSPAADYQISHMGVGKERMFFSLSERGIAVGEYTLKVPGKHNVSNAVAAMIASHIAGMSWDTIRKGILDFTGTKRRFEKLNDHRGGITWYDDYAHHPEEIRATLKAAREWYKTRRIIAVFQPHTYSRTKALLKDFAKAFFDANIVILTDIYASAREHDTLGIDGSTLIDECAKNHACVLYAKDKAMVKALLSDTLKAHDVVIFMGAGDIYTWGKDLISEVTYDTKYNV